MAPPVDAPPPRLPNARRGGNLGTFDPTRASPAEPPRSAPSPVDGTPRLRWIVAGLVAASLAGLVLPSGFTWFLCAIPHEMGHASVGCLLGHPSAPAISLRGEAWTGIAELRPWLVWIVAATFGAFAVAVRVRRAAAIALACAAVAIPICAFTAISDVLIAAGGHLGELAFATYCYALAWTGGRTDTPQERVACAMAGTLIQFHNLELCFGLLTSAAARAIYAGNGSLGLKNDYLLLSEDLLQCRLSAVALGMLGIALLPLPLGLWLGARRARAHAA